MDPSDPLFALTLDPDLLHTFIDELEEAGFLRTSDHTWTGPIALSLAPRTDADEMTILIRAGWPYFPPGVLVEGIKTWHANRDSVCLWQAGDNTRMWVTLGGILARIDEWVDDMASGFARHGFALDPHLYYDRSMDAYTLIETRSLIGDHPSDGQTGNLRWEELAPGVLDIHSGKFRAQDPLPHGLRDRTELRGRWFYRDSDLSPPTNLDELRAALTERQAERFDRDLAQMRTRMLMLVLFWTVENDVAALIVVVDKRSGTAGSGAIAPVPKGHDARLLRAGPHAEKLGSRSVLIIGCGAIGSHVAEYLARSGIQRLSLVDWDRLWPANLVRHAGAGHDRPGIPKIMAMVERLQPFDWTMVEHHPDHLREPAQIQGLIEDVDIVLDSTGDAALADLVARIAQDSGTPFVTAALYRGGAIARVRRQAGSDRPISQRRDHAGYPEISPAREEVEYLGLEVGCAAPINNAPPIAVVRAAALASQMCVDWLTGTHSYDDEVIEVFTTTDPPFDKMGLLRRDEMPVIVRISETAQATIREAVQSALPNETGGVLTGVHVNAHPYVTHAVEIPMTEPSPASFVVTTGKAKEAVEYTAESDARLGYLGEWHSHPTDRGPSPTDRATMQSLAHLNDTGNPILIVVRPRQNGCLKLDAYQARADNLEPVDTQTVGDLPTEEQP